MGRAGLRALEFFDPAKNKHGQAHMQARLVIVAIQRKFQHEYSTQAWHHAIFD
jgi:hypothetical protein